MQNSYKNWAADSDTQIGMYLTQIDHHRCNGCHAAPENYQFQRPTLLFLSGGQVVKPRDAFIGCQFVANRIMNEWKDEMGQIDIAAAYYERLALDDAFCEQYFLRIRKELDCLPEEKRQFFEISMQVDQDLVYPAYVKQLYERYFKPLICDANSLQPRRIEVQEACRNVRRVSILAYCHGTTISMILGDMMAQDMKKLGYDDVETAEIQKQIFVLAVGTTMPMGHARFHTINMISRLDKHATHEFIGDNWNAFLASHSAHNENEFNLLTISDHESIMVVDRLCQTSMIPNTTSEHNFKNYMLKMPGKTIGADTMTCVGRSYLKKGLINSIENQQGTVFVPLQQTFENKNINLIEQAIRRGEREKEFKKKQPALFMYGISLRKSMM